MASLNEILLRDLRHEKDFVLKSGQGDIDTIEGLENMKAALFRRLVTQPGAILHRPDYGVGVKSWQNAIATISQQRALAVRIQEQFLRDSRVEKVNSISIDAEDATPHKIKLIVSVRVVGYGDEEFTFTPFGETV
mgnify:CR=1 FL=1